MPVEKPGVQKQSFEEYIKGNKVVAYEKILVAIDHTYTSAMVFERSLQLAKIFDAKLFVTHVIPTTLPYEKSSKIALEPEYLDLLQEQAQEILNLAKKRIRQEGIKGETQMLEGDPATEILKLIREIDIDLAILGAKEKTSTLAHLGSVSKRVAEEAKCSVLIERP